MTQSLTHAKVGDIIHTEKHGQFVIDHINENGTCWFGQMSWEKSGSCIEHYDLNCTRLEQKAPPQAVIVPMFTIEHFEGKPFAVTQQSHIEAVNNLNLVLARLWAIPGADYARDGKPQWSLELCGNGEMIWNHSTLIEHKAISVGQPWFNDETQREAVMALAEEYRTALENLARGPG